MKKPLRLYRTLRPTAPLFEFTVTDGTRLTDENLQSITIKRGKANRGGGVHPSTAEVATNVFGSVRTGLSCTVALTPEGVARLTGLTGAGTGIRTRFSGRIGRQTVEDTAGHRQTTFLAASWSAQLLRDQTVHTIRAALSASVHSAIIQLMTPPGLPLAAPVRMAPVEQHGTVHTAPEPGTYSDLIGKFTTDLGILVRETRDGNRQILTHALRRDRALAAMATAPTLTRSQVLSPATWEQANDSMPRNYRVLYMDAANTLVTATYGNPDSPATERVDVDMSHIKFATDTSQPAMEGFGRRAADWQSSYAVPSITVDLLALVSSPYQMHRAQAARLLSMEVGDPVYLSGDWYAQLQGIHYAEALNETITPDSWTMELALIPAHVAVGEVSPPVPARTWEAAANPWSADTRTWATT